MTCDKCGQPALYIVEFSGIGRRGIVYDHAHMHLCSKHYDEGQKDQERNPDCVVHSVKQVQHNPL